VTQRRSESRALAPSDGRLTAFAQFRFDFITLVPPNTGLAIRTKADMEKRAGKRWTPTTWRVWSCRGQSTTLSTACQPQRQAPRPSTGHASEKLHDFFFGAETQDWRCVGSQRLQSDGLATFGPSVHRLVQEVRDEALHAISLPWQAITTSGTAQPPALPQPATLLLPSGRA
jgi:hypothetical protein